MKKSKARKLECCCLEFATATEARAFDTLLTRIFGPETFDVRKLKKPRVYEFVFWATPKEQKLIDKLWDGVLDQKWSEEEFEKLMNSN